jgi:hypothetical protein
MDLATTPNRRNRLLAVVVVVVVLAVVLAVWWFQPHKLLIDQRMDEALPGMAPAADGAVGLDTGAGELITLAQGDVGSISHESSGRALVVGLPDGSQVLRFEDLDTDNGPDLRVYLSSATADGPDDAFDDEFVDLGPLKGNVGNQNYELPADIDLANYESAVIWCRRFAVGFAVAPLA